MSDPGITDKTFTSSLAENVKLMDSLLEQSTDLVKREFIFHEKKDIRGVCYFIDGLINTTSLQETFKSLIVIGRYFDDPALKAMTYAQIFERMNYNTNAKFTADVSEAIVDVLSGLTLFLIDGFEQSMIIPNMGWSSRNVDEPSTEVVVRGPRDGFTETIRTNTALIRRRIRDPKLTVDEMKIGTKSRTSVNIMYLKGTVKEGLVEEVKKRLSGIQIDAVLESGYIEELIEDAPFSPFTTVQSTERPDKAAASILEGRVVIIVDNTPFALIVPTYFWSFLQASEDYYSRYWVGSFFRIIRYIAFLISLMLPSIYVMLVSFHQEMIPTALAFTIASGREVVPFPVLFEALVMELAFELMREAGLRMPKPIGQAVSIVGSLIIGQAAVQAGLVSPFMVIIVAVTGIASFTIPNYAASFSIRILRFPLLLASGLLGLLGFAAVFSMLAIHAISLRSFGEPYFSPMTPFRPSDQKDLMLRMPWWSMKKRPQMAAGDPSRIGEHQMPKSPEPEQQSSNRKGRG